ncbi:ATP-binding protein [Pelomonas sp. SE-A7]|uniref:sensor histidine kinase n=1 Tax=Pelomonas sp. SE-A7 TaxID=3054953 RepID=UPI00259C6BDB|nr:ATP-binding protein [Pelomonas sp. SE-A7]MDM4768156.1 7TM diverse intracellular signaling domain-containing protein [Pelomonas sp. SE-A7]
MGCCARAALLILMFLQAGLALACEPPPARPDPKLGWWRIEQACFSLQASTDAAPTAEQSLALPLRWDKLRNGQDGRAWLRLRLPEGNQARALLIERVGNQARLLLNGHRLATLGRDSWQDMAKQSQLLLLPPALLRTDGPNELSIELDAQALRGAILTPLRVGPAAEAEALQARWRLFDQMLPAAYVASFLLMGGLAAALWLRQRDPVYGCYSLAALAGVLRPLDAVWQNALLPWPMWGAALALGYGWQIVLLNRFIVLVLGKNPRWLVHTINVVLTAVTVLASLSFALLQRHYWTAALGLMLTLSLLSLALVLREALRDRQPIAWMVVVSGALSVVAGVHDFFLVRTGWLGEMSRQLTPHALFAFVLVLAWVVVARYSRTLADYRSLNEHLAERVAEREEHLRQAFETLRSQQQEQAVLNERQRIMREIHDGIGSQLVGLLNMVNREGGSQREELETQVRQALDEMRMAVDSLQPMDADLTTVLATLRYRLQPRLQAAGLRVVWDVASLPPLAELSPQAVLQLQRILLEAFTNVLKHARASSVTVTARWIEGHGGRPAEVQLQLLDDGIGPQPAPADAPAGHGLANMRARATSIGAQLDIGPGPQGGTRVAIAWPQAAA